MLSESDYIFAAMHGTQREPANLTEAINGPDAEEWLKAFGLEVAGLFHRGTVVVVRRSEATEYLKSGKRLLRFKVVLKLKLNDENEIASYKCRWVAQGFLATQGMYDEVYAPTLALESFRAIIQTAMQRGHKLFGFDVAQAFLYSPLRETIYCEIQPELRKALEKVGYGIGEDEIVRLDGSLYGIYQGAHDWAKLLAEILQDIGFVRGKREPCYFTRADGMIVSVYVDDGIVSCEKESQYRDALTQMRQNRIQKLTIKDLGLLRKVIGIQVEQDMRQIAIHQRQYIERIVADAFGVDTAAYASRDKWKVDRPYKASLPEAKIRPLREADATRYRSLVGGLLYLMLCTRPDMALAMSQLCKKTNAPTTDDQNKLTHVLMYAYVTRDLALKYEKSEREEVTCIVDADHASDKVTRRSRTGMLTYLGGGLMSWMSKLQGSIALSSMESELYALSAGSCQALGLLNKLHDLNYTCESYVCVSDSEAAINRCVNPVHVSKSKHIATRELFVCDEYDNRKMSLMKIDTYDNAADALTKELAAEIFIRHTNYLFASESERIVRYPERMKLKRKKKDEIEERPEIVLPQPQDRVEAWANDLYRSRE